MLPGVTSPLYTPYEAQDLFKRTNLQTLPISQYSISETSPADAQWTRPLEPSHQHTGVRKVDQIHNLLDVASGRVINNSGEEASPDIHQL